LATIATAVTLLILELRYTRVLMLQVSRIASDATFGGSGEWPAACAAA
jgi:hypothetical protein